MLSMVDAWVCMRMHVSMCMHDVIGKKKFYQRTGLIHVRHIIITFVENATSKMVQFQCKLERVSISWNLYIILHAWTIRYNHIRSTEANDVGEEPNQGAKIYLGKFDIWLVETLLTANIKKWDLEKFVYYFDVSSKCGMRASQKYEFWCLKWTCKVNLILSLSPMICLAVDLLKITGQH